MKILLYLSLGLNVVLAGYLAFRVQVARPPAPADVVYITNSTAVAQESVAPSPTMPAASRAVSLDWRSVESEDYRQYIANLRSIGCPEETIRDIIVADVNKLFEARKQTLPGSTNRFQYWKAGSTPGMPNEERIRQQAELAREKRDLLKTLLGPDFEPKPEPLLAVLDPFQSMLDFLPAAKQTELIALEARYAAKMAGVQKLPGNKRQEEIRKLTAEKQAELASILSPGEKEDYDLRLSQTANTMRNQLTAFEPTEEEFREVFKLRKAFDDQWNTRAPQTAEERAERTAAQQQLDSEIKSALGDQRYADYKYAGEWAKSTLQQLSQEYNIPKETAYKVFDLKSVAQNQVRQFRQDQTLTPEQRQFSIRSVRDETERAVMDVLGPRVAEEYINRGNWIKSLSPDPAPNPGTARAASDAVVHP